MKINLLPTFTVKLWKFLSLITISTSLLCAGLSSAHAELSPEQLVRRMDQIRYEMVNYGNELSRGQLLTIEQKISEIEATLRGGNIRCNVPQGLIDSLKSSSWTTRRDAVKIIATYRAQCATLLLIGALKDGDTDVRNEANARLNERELYGQDVVDALSSVIQSVLWQVRVMAVQQLSRMADYSVDLVLISKMDDGDTDVRNAIFSALDRRFLSRAHVGPLAEKFGAVNWVVRKSVAYFLGKTNSRAAVRVLSDRLAIESDSDVKNQIQQSILQLRNSD